MMKIFLVISCKMGIEEGGRVFYNIFYRNLNSYLLLFIGLLLNLMRKSVKRLESYLGRNWGEKGSLFYFVILLLVY